MEKRLFYLYMIPMFMVSWNPLFALYSYLFIFNISFLVWIRSGFLKLASYEYAIFLAALVALTSAVINANFDSTFLSLYIAAPMAIIGLRRISSVSLTAWCAIGLAYVAGCALLVFQVFFLKFFGSFEGERFSAFDLNANYLAYCLTMGEVVFVSLIIVKVKNFYTKFICIFILASFSAVILLTGSRGAIMAVSFLYLTIIARMALTRPIFSIFLFICFVVIGHFAYEALPLYIQNRLINGDDSGGDISSGRFESLTVALDIFLNNLFLGIGPGIMSKISPGKIQVHNALASVFAELGFVGGVAYLSAILLIFNSFFFKESKSYLSIFFGSILLVAWFPIAMTGVWEVSMVAWMLFGWFLAFLRISSNSKIDIQN